MLTAFFCELMEGRLEQTWHDHLERWGLAPDGEPIITPTSRLLPVRLAGVPLMLKISILDEERRGGRLMRWWCGQGAARVLAHSNDAILIERADKALCLVDMARHGADEEASRTICAVVAQLHAHRAKPPPALLPLTAWFDALPPAARAQGGILGVAATTASTLLAAQQDVVPLHGDVHHGNILHFGGRGWLAIDPKGLIGERYFDYANIFCNPDHEMATAPDRLTRQLQVVAQAAQLEPRRLLAWIVAWAGLSAAFLLDDGLPADGAIRMAELAAAELSR
jgi:streptomycin 6-kinase